MKSPRRQYDPIPEKRRGLRDFDAADRAFMLKTLAWSLPGGLVGALGGFKFAGGPGALVGLILGYGLVYAITRSLTSGGATAMGQIHNPTGASTPAIREYSQAQSLAARGLYQESIEAYELACAEYPEDPEPFFRIARLYLVELKRYDDAIVWFKKARGAGGINAGRELVATQEIVDIYIHKLKEPRRAMPELARLTERFPGTPAGDWASEQLRMRRESLAREMEGQEGQEGQ